MLAIQTLLLESKEKWRVVIFETFYLVFYSDLDFVFSCNTLISFQILINFLFFSNLILFFLCFIYPIKLPTVYIYMCLNCCVKNFYTPLILTFRPQFPSKYNHNVQRSLLWILMAIFMIHSLHLHHAHQISKLNHNPVISSFYI